jgi:hypothetical protein
LETDGWVDYAPPATTHVRILLEPGLEPVGGCWVPDTCAAAVVRLPLGGTGVLDVRLAAGRRAPEEIVLFGEETPTFPDHVVPHMTLKLASTRDAERGGTVARYEGRIRTDLLGVGRWFPRGVGTERRSVLVHLDRYHVEEVALTE